MHSAISVEVAPCFDEFDNPAFCLAIYSPSWSLNIRMYEDELAVIPRVRNARWSERGSLRIGTTAGAPCFWSCEDGKLSILIGADDETWDIGFTLPEGTIDEVIAEIGPVTNPGEQVDG